MHWHVENIFLTCGMLHNNNNNNNDDDGNDNHNKLIQLGF